MIAAEEYLTSATYAAPFGKRRMYELAKELSLRYLYSSDLLIGIIGAEGSGKSTLIRGLFPGLELTNDDEGVNNRRTPLFDFSDDDFFSGHTFHIDVRFEQAFRQMHEICDAVIHAVECQRRVVIEHFDLLYRHLGFNAQLLFVIGDEVQVFRPTVFGPSPVEVKKRAEKSVKYRLMAHSAEDITLQVLREKYEVKMPDIPSSVKHGFVIGFSEKPSFSISELEQEVLDIIKRDVPIVPLEGDFIELDGTKIACTGKRVHVESSRQIENFRFAKQLRYDPISKEYLLVGLVGKEAISGLRTLPPVSEEFTPP